METRFLRCVVTSFALFVAGAARAAPVADPPYFGWAAFGASIGVRGFALAENILFAGGGTPSPTYFHGMRWDAAANTLRHRHVHQATTSPVFLRSGDVVGAGTTDLVTAQVRDIEIFEPVTMTRIGAFSVGTAGSISGLAVGDLDGNGVAEIVVLILNKMSVYAANGALLWQVTPFDADQSVRVAQLDADPAREIVLSKGAIYDGATHAVQTTYVPGFGGQDFTTGDIDADGIDEIAFRVGSSTVSFLDVPSLAIQSSIPITSGQQLAVGNVDLDPGMELVVGGSSSGSLRVYDVATQALEGIFPFSSGSTAVDVLDVVPGGPKEIVTSWGQGGTNWFALIRGTDMKALYKSDTIDGPMHGPFRGDLDADGTDEIVVVSQASDNGGGNGRIVVFDAETVQVEATSQAIQGSGAGHGVNDALLADLDGDGSSEIVVATDVGLGASLIGIHFDGGTKTFTNVFESTTWIGGQRFASVGATDLTGDGKPDLVAGLRPTTSGIPPGAQIYAFAGTTGAELWHSAPLSTTAFGETSQIKFGNVDGDAAIEILAVTRGEAVHVIDPATHAIQQTLPGNFFCAAPIIGGLIAGDGLGQVHFIQWNGSALATRGFKKVVATFIDAVEFAPNGILTVASDGVLRAFTIRSGAMPLVFASKPYGQAFGKRVVVAGSPATSLLPISAGAYGVAPIE